MDPVDARRPYGFYAVFARDRCPRPPPRTLELGEGGGGVPSHAQLRNSDASSSQSNTRKYFLTVTKIPGCDEDGLLHNWEVRLEACWSVRQCPKIVPKFDS